MAPAALLATLPVSPVAGAAAPLSIRVAGNHFVNSAGQTIRLLGVDHPSEVATAFKGDPAVFDVFNGPPRGARHH